MSNTNKRSWTHRELLQIFTDRMNLTKRVMTAGEFIDLLSSLSQDTEEDGKGESYFCTTCYKIHGAGMHNAVSSPTVPEPCGCFCHRAFGSVTFNCPCWCHEVQSTQTTLPERLNLRNIPTEQLDLAMKINEIINTLLAERKS